LRYLRISRRSNGQFKRKLPARRDAEITAVVTTRTMRIRKKVTTKRVLKSKRDRDLERIKERRMKKPRKRVKTAPLLPTRTIILRRRSVTSPAATETETTSRKTKRTKKVTKMAVTRKVVRTSLDRSQELDLTADLITRTIRTMRKTRKLTTTITITTEIDATRARKDKLMTRTNLKDSIINNRKVTKITKARVAMPRITKTMLLLPRRFTCPSA